MSFASRIIRLPRPFEPDLGAEALAATPWAEGDVATLIEGTGGTSPYLQGLIRKEADWLHTALDDSDAALPALFAELDAGAPDEVDVALRQAKRRVALLAGLSDLAGVWTLEEVTGALTRFADLAVQKAL